MHLHLAAAGNIGSVRVSPERLHQLPELGDGQAGQGGGGGRQEDVQDGQEAHTALLQDLRGRGHVDRSAVWLLTL